MGSDLWCLHVCVIFIRPSVFVSKICTALFSVRFLVGKRERLLFIDIASLLNELPSCFSSLRTGIFK